MKIETEIIILPAVYVLTIVSHFIYRYVIVLQMPHRFYKSTSSSKLFKYTFKSNKGRVRFQMCNCHKLIRVIISTVMGLSSSNTEEERFFRRTISPLLSVDRQAKSNIILLGTGHPIYVDMFSARIA